MKKTVAVVKRLCEPLIVVTIVFGVPLWDGVNDLGTCVATQVVTFHYVLLVRVRQRRIVLLLYIVLNICVNLR
jgi:hypothetical protein